MAGIPETQYAQSGDLSIAYQTIGDGPNDVLFVPGFVSNVELMWEMPGTRHQLERLSSIGRLIVFDKRGTGCSDRSLGTGSAEDRMDDLRAVADAAGVESANLVGLSEGGPLAVLFATTFPERVRRAGAARSRRRSRAQDGAVHRHRRLDGAGRGAR